MKKYYVVPAEVIESNFPEDDLSVYQIIFLPSKDKNEAIYDEMGNYLSVSDNDDYPAIVTALKKALKTEPDSLLNFVEYDKDGEPEFIPVWEKVENKFTVVEFCDLVGIKES